MGKNLPGLPLGAMGALGGILNARLWRGGWVGYGKVEEDEAVGMRYCGLRGGGGVGR